MAGNKREVVIDFSVRQEGVNCIVSLNHSAVIFPQTLQNQESGYEFKGTWFYTSDYTIRIAPCLYTDFHSSEVASVPLGDMGGDGEIAKEPLDSDKVVASPITC